MTREELINGFGNSFMKLSHTYDVCMHRMLSKYGLYPGQPQILFALSEMNSPTQMQLADRLGLTKTSVGTSLRRMEQSGFIKRMRDKKDVRCIRIALTQKGVEYTRWCRLDFDMLFTTMMEGFTGDERERAVSYICRMGESLDELRERLES